MSTRTIDETKLEAFIGKVVQEAGAAMNAALVVLGDELGLYAAMDSRGPVTPAALAEATGTHERYVREWLNAQAAGGFVAYHPETETYELPPEQAVALTDETSPAFVPGLFEVVLAAIHDGRRIGEDFTAGHGVGWHEHDHGLYRGTERFFRPAYNANLVAAWIPALEGVEAKLRDGARVADVGCGHGASTIIMAQAFPRSRFVGYDYHRESIDTARRRAREAEVADRVSFEVAPASSYSGTGFDLVAFFDCLHDMGDPTGVAAHVHSTLSDDGTWMIVEPRAGDRLEDNLNPLGRLYYGASTLICTPSSLAQEGRAALGAQAGEARIREVVLAGGFRRFRRAAEAPANLVFEARP